MDSSEVALRRDNPNVMPSMREWWEARRPQAKPKPIPPPIEMVKLRTPLTELERRAIAAISPGRVTYVPGIGTKRFARDISRAQTITDAQRQYLWQVVWRYRRQIADKELVEMAKEKQT